MALTKIKSQVLDVLSPALGVSSGGTGLSNPGASGNVLTSNGSGFVSSPLPPILSIGVDQTWQTVTSTRALNTVYTNNTTKPIMVNVFVNDAGASSSSLYINNMVVASNYGNSVGGYSGSTLSAIVPVGATYKVTQGAGNSGWGPWLELR